MCGLDGVTGVMMVSLMTMVLVVLIVVVAHRDGMERVFLDLAHDCRHGLVRRAYTAHCWVVRAVLVCPPGVDPDSFVQMTFCGERMQPDDAEASEGPVECVIATAVPVGVQSVDDRVDSVRDELQSGSMVDDVVRMPLSDFFVMLVVQRQCVGESVKNEC